jgi:hypothetical protein
MTTRTRTSTTPTRRPIGSSSMGQRGDARLLSTSSPAGRGRSWPPTLVAMPAYNEESYIAKTTSSVQSTRGCGARRRRRLEGRLRPDRGTLGAVVTGTRPTRATRGAADDLFYRPGPRRGELVIIDARSAQPGTSPAACRAPAGERRRLGSRFVEGSIVEIPASARSG